MKKFKSVRNGQVAELVSENDKQVIIKLESGEEKALSPTTLKRWWKPMEDKEMQEQSQSEEVAEEAIQEEATETVEEPAEEKEETPAEQEEPANEEPASEEPKQKETKSEKKTKTEKASKQKRETISGDHPLKAFIEQLAAERGTEVFKATVPSFRSLKVDGKMYMAFTFNKKGITLWMRSKAVQNLTQFKKTNHMFDARVHFDEETKANKEKITKLLDASLEFQKNKQAGKASK